MELDALTLPDWTVETDADYARWYSSQPLDPSLLYSNPPLVFAVLTGLLPASLILD